MHVIDALVHAVTLKAYWHERHPTKVRRYIIRARDIRPRDRVVGNELPTIMEKEDGNRARS